MAHRIASELAHMPNSRLPVDAPPEVLGTPCVVFAGNVGDDGTLAQVVAIIRGEQEVP